MLSPRQSLKTTHNQRNPTRFISTYNLPPSI
jgi:hypothetical protein